MLKPAFCYLGALGWSPAEASSGVLSALLEGVQAQWEVQGTAGGRGGSPPGCDRERGVAWWAYSPGRNSDHHNERRRRASHFLTQSVLIIHGV